MDCSMTTFPIHHCLPGFAQLMSLSPWCHPIISSSVALLLLPSIFSSIRVFSNELALHIRWPMYWSFSFSINPSNEYSGLISFRIDWFDVLAVQETLKSFLQHHHSKASVLWRSSFFMVQLSHSYMTTGKTISLTRWTFVHKVISFMCNSLQHYGRVACHSPLSMGFSRQE